MAEGTPPPPITPTASSSPAVPATAVLPAGLLGWMTFAGILTLLSGAVRILTCVGLPSGVLLLVAGFGILGARSALEAVPTLDPSLIPFFRKLKTAVVAVCWAYVIGFVLFLLLMLIYVVALGMRAPHGGLF